MSETANTQQILISNNDGICTITINRESKMNALNIRLLSEIKEAVEEAQTNPEICGIILTGAGNKAFAAGADIAEFAEFTSQQGEQMSTAGHLVMNTIENSSKPVIAAVNGFSLGGGCELAMACHMRVASTNALFGQPEVNLGLIPGYGGTQRLIQLVGKGKSLEMLLTGDAIKADEALKFGLVNYVVEQDELMGKCQSILNKISRKSPTAAAKIIDCVNHFFATKKDGMQKEIEEFGNSFQTPDFKEGTDAFLNKRRPSFKR